MSISKVLTSDPVFYRTYSRIVDGTRESWGDVIKRTVSGLAILGDLTIDEINLLMSVFLSKKAMPSGRWLWVGGTKWIQNPKNFPGAYNCSSTNIDCIDNLAIVMELAMMGCGTGAIISEEYVNKLPKISVYIDLEVLDNIGTKPKEDRIEKTKYGEENSDVLFIEVGDSRKGWVQTYKDLLEIATDSLFDSYSCKVVIDLSNVRAKGEKLEGFGGVANPIKLKEMFEKIVDLLNSRFNEKLRTKDVCLLIDIPALAIVAGNIRRSAGIRQFNSGDVHMTGIKSQMWQQKENGSWNIDPTLDPLRMANHTAMYFTKPTLTECIESVRMQHKSGEGAIQFVPEAIARSNADILYTEEHRHQFIEAYCENPNLGKAYIGGYMEKYDEKELEYRIGVYGTNPCFSAGTMVMTQNGHYPIEDLVGKKVTVWNGVTWTEIDNFRVTAENQPVFNVTLQNGQTITTTDYHSFILENGERKIQKDLLVGDKLMDHGIISHGNVVATGAYLKGFLVGDGTNHQGNAKLSLYAPKYCCENRLLLSASELKLKQLATRFNSETNYNYSNWGFGNGDKVKNMTGLSQVNLIDWVTTNRVNFPVDIFTWDLQSKCNFIAGVMDADGCATDGKKGFGYQITSIHQSWLLDFQLLLKTIGVDSKVNPVRKGCIKDFGENRGGCYNVKDTHRISIAQSASVKLAKLCKFERLKSHADKITKYNLSERWNKIVSIEFSHIADKVYCCTIPQFNQFALSNGIQIGQCGEITLCNNFCNLSEVHLPLLDPNDYVEQREAFRAAGLAAAVLLNHEFEEEIHKYSRSIDPIVGVSFTGLFDFFVHAFGVDWLKWWAEGRPHDLRGQDFLFKEADYLERWRRYATNAVWEYCDEHNLRRPNRCTTVQPAGCLTVESLRVSDDGLFYLDEICSENTGIFEFDEINLRDGLTASSGVKNELRHDLVEITLSHGRKVTSTPDHRFSINGDWVEAQHIKQNQTIDFEVGKYEKINETMLEKWFEPDLISRGRQQQRCELPETMSPDLGYFIGALFGNGCFSLNCFRIRFSHSRLDVLDKLSDIGNRLFGLSGTLNADNSGNRYELCFSNKQLYNWFILNGLDKPTTSKNLDRIPFKLRNASKKSIIAFFSGLLDTDGCIRENGTFSIDMSSENFIRNLQQIGEAVGLVFGISHNTKGNNHQDIKSMWSLSFSKCYSNVESVKMLNQFSIKSKYREIVTSSATNGKKAFIVSEIKYNCIGETYDITVNTDNDDESWYWQGALKSHNTKSLLTGSSPGWHPPKAIRYIRRITFGKNDPIALACMEMGYSIVPSPSDTDKDGNLLSDPFDDACTEWLVEIPISVSWADLPGIGDIDPSQFSALAQFDFYMQVQTHYTTHNTSATIELREHEVEELGTAIYNAIQNNDGYISAALLARFDDYQSFPRLPFEPIDKITYDRLVNDVAGRAKFDTFEEALAQVEDNLIQGDGPAQCDSDKCLIG